MCMSVADPDLERQEAPATRLLHLSTLIQTVTLGGEPVGNPRSQINFLCYFESQLSLRKGGGKSPGSTTVYICFLIYLFIFFSQQVILLFATSSKEKGSFFTIKLLGNYIMHPHDPPERIKLTSHNALSLCQDPWFPLLPLPIPYKRKMPHHPLGCQDIWSLVQAHPCVPTVPSHLSSAAQT